MGLTFEVFEDDKPLAEGETAPVKEEYDDEGNLVPQLQFEKDEKIPKFLVVPEVVREPKVHFFKVPRLGSYMAIRLEYQTCLFEEAFDAGVADLIRVNELRQRQDEEKANHEQSQAELKAEAEAAGDNFKPDEREWQTIDTKPY